MTTLKCNILSIAFALTPQICSATNIINLIGFGTESIAMGGADAAISSSSSTLVTNPAGLYQITNNQVDIYTVTSISKDIKYTDTLGNNIKANTSGNFIGFTYANKLRENDLALGIGLFVTEGSGAKYSNVITPFGTIDDIHSSTDTIRLMPGITWQVSKKLEIGFSATLIYASREQSFLPNTSFTGATVEQSFYGFAIEDATTTTQEFKLGIMYHPTSTTTFGFTYTSETKLTLDDGKATIDFTALGLGKVNYREARIGGQNAPQEMTFGIAHEASENWLLAADISWLNWRQSAKQVFLFASEPDNPFAPLSISQTFPLDWKNQTILALGVKYKVSETSAFQFGLNLANNPVPNKNQSPALSTFSTKHITAGYSKNLNKGTRFSIAIDYQKLDKTTYTNTQQPFGPNASIALDALFLHIQLSHSW